MLDEPGLGERRVQGLWGSERVGTLEQMQKYSVDVVLTDYHMPEMNGFVLLSLCRVKWRGIPVVFFSGEQDDMAHEAR